MITLQLLTQHVRSASVARKIALLSLVSFLTFTRLALRPWKRLANVVTENHYEQKTQSRLWYTRLRIAN